MYFHIFTPQEGNCPYDPSDGIWRPTHAKALPKVGHWRTTPGGKHKMSPRKVHAVMWPSNVGPDHVPTTRQAASIRSAVRAAVEAGLIAPEDRPSWAQ